MALLYSQAATATVAANSNSIAVTGMDLTPVLQGMVVYLGARDRVTGDGYIIADVALNGSNGGTITTVGALPAFNSAAFVIDTRDFNGSAPNYLIAMYTVVLTALLKLTSPLTNLFSGSRVLALDKDASNAVSRLLYAIGGRVWGALEQRTLTFTPTGAATTTAETLALRAFTDGTTPSDAILIDLTTGGVDIQAALTGMSSATMVDLASAPIAKVAIYGAASISSFGPGKNKVRDVFFVDGGATLVHNATALILPTRSNIVTRAGDSLRAVSDSSGNWRVLGYQRADGTASATGGLYPTTGFAAEGSKSDFANNGVWLNVLAVDFVATATRLLGYATVDFTNSSGIATDVQAQLVFVDMTAGGTTIATGRKQIISLPATQFTGSGNLNPMVQINNLVPGRTYRVQLQLLRVQANGPIAQPNIHVGGINL